MDNYLKRRVCILVKAYPQPSQKYEETVCVAAVTEAHELVRLYPIRFRHLPEDKRFNRFDWIEVDMTRALDDPRPESFKVKEDSIRIVLREDKQSPEDKVRLWKSSVVEWHPAQPGNRSTRLSFGAIHLRAARSRICGGSGNDPVCIRAAIASRKAADAIARTRVRFPLSVHLGRQQT